MGSDLRQIENPDHYCFGRKYEPKDVIRDWGLNFNLGNVVKYVSRAGRKGGCDTITDLKKAAQYLQFEISALEEDRKQFANEFIKDLEQFPVISDEDLPF